MKRIVEMHDRLVGPVNDQVVLNEIIGAETEEVDTGRHQIARLRCSKASRS